MHSIMYAIGLIVVVMVVLSFSDCDKEHAMTDTTTVVAMPSDRPQILTGARSLAARSSPPRSHSSCLPSAPQPELRPSLPTAGTIPPP